VIKVGFRQGLNRDEALDLVIRALWEAADADSATGGPDPLRGIYPTVATISAQGFVAVTDAELAERFAAAAQSDRGVDQ
jgi:proteasome beta subunit